MKENTYIPRFVSIVAITLGCLDLVRGFMHTIALEYAALNIVGFDLSTTLAGDLLQIMGAFGISNYLTGVMLILIGWQARHLALAMLGVTPVAYVIGATGIEINSADYAPSQAAWGGAKMMMVYRYAARIMPYLISVGGYPDIIGHVEGVFVGDERSPLHDDWSDFAMVYYPSRQNFINMMTNAPREGARHRDAGLQRAVLMPSSDWR